MNETQNAEHPKAQRITGVCNGNHRVCNCGCVHHPNLVQLQDGPNPGQDTIQWDELIIELSGLYLQLSSKVQKLEEIAAISARFR